MSDIIEKINEVEKSLIPENQKIQQLVCFIENFNFIDNPDALILVCDLGLLYAQRLNMPEAEAQFYIIRAKTLMTQTLNLILEIKNITLAPSWFQFALETENNKHMQLNSQVKIIWDKVQLDIEKAFESINKNPVDNVVAFVYQITGEIYGLQHSQLKLFYLKTNSSFCARLSNMKIFQWLGISDFFIFDKASRHKLKKMKKDCIKSIYRSMVIFKRLKDYADWANALLTLSIEYYSFQSYILAKLYLIFAERLIRKYKISKLANELSRIKKI